LEKKIATIRVAIKEELKIVDGQDGDHLYLESLEFQEFGVGKENRWDSGFMQGKGCGNPYSIILE